MPPLTLRINTRYGIMMISATKHYAGKIRHSVKVSFDFYYKKKIGKALTKDT